MFFLHISFIKKIIYPFFIFFFVVSFVFLAKKNNFFQEDDLLHNPSSERCAECHKKIFEQWSKSRHAKAWTSPGFKKESEGYTKQKCMGCHNPSSIIIGSKPGQRTTYLDEGVSCPACHFINKKMEGPFELYNPLLYLYGLFSPPHPFQFNSKFFHSGFCRSCHEKTYDEWRSTKVITTCHECHMKTSRENMMDKFPQRLLHGKVAVGDHSTPLLKINEDDIRFELRVNESELEITLENTRIPHNLPTADTGDPRLYLILQFITPDDVISHEEKIIFAPQLDSALKYRNEWSETFTILEDSVKVKAQLLLKKPWKNKKDFLMAKEKAFLQN